MKKKLLSIALIALACVTAFAQDDIFNNPSNKIYFGIRVGGEVIAPSKISVGNIGMGIFKKGGGIEFGGICNIPIVANFYIEPGINFYYNSTSYDEDFVKELEDDIIFNSGSLKKLGFRVPVMLGYHFDFTEDIKVSLFTGPELEIGCSAKEYIKGHNIETSGSLYGKDGDLNRVDLLWGVGAGISYQHLYFGVKGNFGLLNMLSDSYAKLHENRATFSVGYNF